MGKRIGVFLILLVILAGASACATSEQWAQWRQHSSHFASADHLIFSFRNERKPSAPRVTARDVEEAKVQRWWGVPVVVRPDALVKG